jgi:hypothetical protein
MGTGKEFNLRPKDIATTVSAHARPNGADVGISLVPDVTWIQNSNYTVDPVVEYRVTKIAVTEVDDYTTRGTVIATNDQMKKPGQVIGIHSGFKNFVGGEGERTFEELKRAGVEIHDVFVEKDGIVESGIKVEAKYKTLGEYVKEVHPPETFVYDHLNPEY